MSQDKSTDTDTDTATDTEPGTTQSPEDIVRMWFGDTATGRLDLPQAKRWFMGGQALDEELAARFSTTLERARSGQLDHWQNSARDALALIILLDQFNRNMHRATAEAYAGDAQALAVCRLALDRQYDLELPVTQRVFCYMPLEHDESVESQVRSVALFEKLLEDAPPELKDFAEKTLDAAREHKTIIDQFGRYPYRNAVLGRTSTPDEVQWLSEGNKRFGQ